jgi:hypothetical protein
VHGGKRVAPPLAISCFRIWLSLRRPCLWKRRAVVDCETRAQRHHLCFGSQETRAPQPQSSFAKMARIPAAFQSSRSPTNQLQLSGAPGGRTSHIGAAGSRTQSRRAKNPSGENRW